MSKIIGPLEGPAKKRYKFPIYPNKHQKEYLDKTFGCCRKVWNTLLAKAIKDYSTYQYNLENNIECIKPNVSSFSLSNQVTVLKYSEGFEYLQEPLAYSLTDTAQDLGTSFKNFFNGKGYPKFKKKSNRQSFNIDKIFFKIEGNRIKPNKCPGAIKMKLHRELPSKPSSARFIKTPSGEYYVSFVCEYNPPKLNAKGTIGIDLGIKDIITTSSGTKIPNPKHYEKAQKKLKRLQQSLSRKEKGSNNREKARIKLAKQHAHIANQRMDFAHNLSRQIVNDNQVICLENLNVKGMVRNRHLAKSISSVSWSMLCNFIEYKTRESQNSSVVYVDRFYPSSHTCSIHHTHIGIKLKLSDRQFKCPVCKEIHDRDINAAKNILFEGMQRLFVMNLKLNSNVIVKLN